MRKVLSLKALGGFSLFVATDGYVGKSATYEYGIAQSCGIPTIFTEEPQDVPFYVDPQTIRNIDQLSETLVNHPDTLLRPPRATNETANTWSSLAFPTALVAVGGIVRCTDRRIILSTDGRWQNHALTVPGSTVRVRETRDATLKRVLSDKLQLGPWSIKSVQPFATEFMIEDSGYDKPGVAIGTMVFDDRVIDLNNCTVGSTNPHLHPLTPDEVRDSIAAGEVEPNAALLLTRYLLHEQQKL